MHIVPCRKSKHVSVEVLVVAKDWMWMDMLPLTFCPCTLSHRRTDRASRSAQRPASKRPTEVALSEPARMRSGRIDDSAVSRP